MRSVTPLTGLYDHQGMLRFAGFSPSDCLAYAELFALPDGSFTLESLEKVAGLERRMPSDCEGLTS